jgi:hypothetical protein
MVNEDAFSRDELPVRYLPFLVVGLVGVVVAITAVLYAFSDNSAPGPCPTISYTAIGFPANRFFAVGLALTSVLIVSLCFIQADVFRLIEAPVIANLIMYTSFLSGVLFFLTGQFNLGEMPVVHSMIAFFAFFSVIILNLYSLIGEIRTGKERLTAVKLSCVVVPIWNLVGLALLGQMEVTPVQFAIFGIFEYVVVLGGSIGAGLYFFDLRGVHVFFCVEMPQERASGEEPEFSEMHRRTLEEPLEEHPVIN